MKHLIHPNIKRFVVILSIALFSSGHIVAQGMPVYDNTNFISLAKQLIESAKQTSNLLKTVEFLKQQKEMQNIVLVPKNEFDFYIFCFKNKNC